MTRTAWFSGLLSAVAVIASPAAASPGLPGSDYFTGTYGRVGRDGGDPSALIDDRVRVEPDGTALKVSDCAGRVTRFEFAPSMEITNLLAGQGDAGQVFCLFHNNGDNHAILTCEAQDGARYTLWPVTGLPSAAPLACGG